MNDSKSIPTFSIILPTRGRGYYIGNTIKSLLYQDYEDYELIIVDNNEDDLTYQEIQRYPSTKIRYFKTGNLPMWENWDFGYRQALGKFIIILTDRSLLYSRDSLSYLNALTSQNNYDVFTWPMIVALETEDFKVDSQLLWGLGNDKNIVLTKNDYREFILTGQWDKYGMSAPKGFNSCISRELCSKIVDIYGSLYMPLNPDYSHSFMVLNSCEQVLYLSQPLFISANLKDSYESKVKVFQNDEAFYKQFGISKKQSTEFCPIKSDVITGWNMVYNDLYKVMLIHGGLIDIDKVFTDAFLISTLKYCQKYRYDDEDLIPIIQRAISSYLDNHYPSVDPIIRQELSKTIEYTFYKDNEISTESIGNYGILATIKDIIKKDVIKRNLKKVIHFLDLLLGKNKDIFSLFLQNSIR